MNNWAITSGKNLSSAESAFKLSKTYHLRYIPRTGGIDTMLEKYALEKENIAAIGVGIEDPMFEQPAIHLNNKNAKMNTIYKLWDLKNNA